VLPRPAGHRRGLALLATGAGSSDVGGAATGGGFGAKEEAKETAAATIRSKWQQTAAGPDARQWRRVIALHWAAVPVSLPSHFRRIWAPTAEVRRATTPLREQGRALASAGSREAAGAGGRLDLGWRRQIWRQASVTAVN
jgi:hypothetical protein